jgi:hypothetical protein
MSSDSDFWDVLRQRQAFELVRDVVFAYVAVSTTYQMGSALYYRGLVTTLSDCQRWAKLVSAHFGSCLTGLVETIPGASAAARRGRRNSKRTRQGYC